MATSGTVVWRRLAGLVVVNALRFADPAFHLALARRGHVVVDETANNACPFSHFDQEAQLHSKLNPPDPLSQNNKPCGEEMPTPIK